MALNNNNDKSNGDLLELSSSMNSQQNDASSLSSLASGPLNNNNFYEVTRVDHQNKMTNELQKMFYNEKLCDVTIVCNGKSVKAHQVVLAASSSYFKEIFHSTPPGFSPIVFLKNFTNEDLNDILEFVYNGQINAPCNRLESLVDSAKSLGISGLSELRLNNNDPSLETHVTDVESQENIDSDNKSDLDSSTTNTNSTTKRKRRKKKSERFSVYSPMKKTPKTDLKNGIDSIPQNNNHNSNDDTNTNQYSMPALRPRSSMITKSTTNDLEVNISSSPLSLNTNINKNSKKDSDNNTNNTNSTTYKVNGKILRNRNNNNNNTDNNNVKTNNHTNDSSTDLNEQNLDSNSSNNLISDFDTDREMARKILQSNYLSLKHGTPASIVSDDYENNVSASLENNNGHIKINPANRFKFADMNNSSMIKLVARQRGRPKKIIIDDNNFPNNFNYNYNYNSMNGDKKINNVSNTNNFGKNNQSQSKIFNGSSTSLN